jgi:hypothetical protein
MTEILDIIGGGFKGRTGESIFQRGCKARGRHLKMYSSL